MKLLTASLGPMLKSLTIQLAEDLQEKGGRAPGSPALAGWPSDHWATEALLQLKIT